MEVDPFDKDFVRVIFHAVYVYMVPGKFTELAKRLSLDTWTTDDRASNKETKETLSFPNEHGICPELKFRIKSVSEWKDNRPLLVEAAKAIFEATQERIYEGCPPTANELTTLKKLDKLEDITDSSLESAEPQQPLDEHSDAIDQ